MTRENTSKPHHRRLIGGIDWGRDENQARRSRSPETKREKRQDERGEKEKERERWDAARWNRWFMRPIRRRGTVSGRQSPRHLSSLFAMWPLRARCGMVPELPARASWRISRGIFRNLTGERVPLCLSVSLLPSTSSIRTTRRVTSTFRILGASRRDARVPGVFEMSSPSSAPPADRDRPGLPLRDETGAFSGIDEFGSAWHRTREPFNKLSLRWNRFHRTSVELPAVEPSLCNFNNGWFPTWLDYYLNFLPRGNWRTSSFP